MQDFLEADMKKTELDPSEQDVLSTFEKDEWVPVGDRDEAIAKHRAYARNTMGKDRRMNIRHSERDLEGLQTMALEDGIPYQTLMSSILHRYVSGRLVDLVYVGGCVRYGFGSGA